MRSSPAFNCIIRYSVEFNTILNSMHNLFALDSLKINTVLSIQCEPKFLARKVKRMRKSGGPLHGLFTMKSEVNGGRYPSFSNSTTYSIEIIMHYCEIRSILNVDCRRACDMKDVTPHHLLYFDFIRFPCCFY